MEAITPIVEKTEKAEKESKWYVLRVVSGKERKIKEYLDKDIVRNGWNNIVKQVFLPVEKVYKVLNGKKVMRERNFYPGYIMIEVADGKLNDVQDVVVGSTNASLFGYVADGRNGLKVLQLTAPDTQPRFYGFSPEPKPQLIAWRQTKSAAIALSKGLDRDRAVDETGNQIAVFGRIGARPFVSKEMEKLYLQPNGQVWKVTDQISIKDFVARSGKNTAAIQKGIK